MPTKSKANGDAIEAFFADIASRGEIPLLESVSGTIRVDVVESSGVRHWYISVRQGEVHVSHKSGKADGVLRVDQALLEDIVTGRKQAMAAVLREAIVPEGDLNLLIAFQRLFPGRVGSQGRVPPIREVSQTR